MKVYSVETPDYDGSHIYGIYSSHQKALDSFPYHDREMTLENIVEYEVDPEHGEKYEHLVYVHLYSNGTSKSSTYWSLPSQHIGGSLQSFLVGDPFKPSLSPSSYGFSSCGVGRTEEEALTTARKWFRRIKPVWQVSGTVNVARPRIEDIYNWNGSYAVHEDYNVALEAWNKFCETGVVTKFIYPK